MQSRQFRNIVHKATHATGAPPNAYVSCLSVVTARQLAQIIHAWARSSHGRLDQGTSDLAANLAQELSVVRNMWARNSTWAEYSTGQNLDQIHQQALCTAYYHACWWTIYVHRCNRLVTPCSNSGAALAALPPLMNARVAQM